MFLLACMLMGIIGFSSAAVSPENVTYEIKRPVPLSAKKFVSAIAQNFAKRDDIDDLIILLRDDMVEEHVTQLSGEHDASTQQTRVSNSISNANGIMRACEYVERMMGGYGFTVEVDFYNSNYGPNVISSLRGTTRPDELVIFGAHLDDIPSSGRAPGGNDDGSGSAALLAMAQTIYEKGARFERTLVFEHYTGEEQGLRGSRALAQKRNSRNDDVKAHVQQDMVALLRAGDPVGVAFVQDSRATDRDLTRYVQDVAIAYADPGLTIYNQVLSGSSCCSDHQSYHEQGYPSVGLIEPRGYTGDPQYHRSGDVVNRADFSIHQVALTARVSLAAAADLADLV